MQQLLKRLSIIKASVALEDYEIIELQISKIQSLELDNEAQSIIEQLNEHQYISAISSIDRYIDKNTGLVVYEGAQSAALKLELKMLELKLQGLSDKKMKK
ncbi:hypothetical protein AB4140_18725 [Shewanella sp. 10N.286.51.B2]|uniref:hypothetical protein n=1 Tax=Shewanella sp. 10N.286.51.B2 TaxID=3229707 RepID=UPI00354B38CF